MKLNKLFEELTPEEEKQFEQKVAEYWDGILVIAFIIGIVAVTSLPYLNYSR